ncbi:Glu-tRNA(Gln) amidotransferase subunit GatE [Candidatus Pacearchaeota archaeon]|nr:Glu-tRNA(Gln) amidotransferase subunit GatE [Candidatus Pacearchaeota archaeon]
MNHNYKELGFKSGLEIHQQLDTGKLFCKCPSLLRKDEPEFEIRRKLHVVAGESGKVDEAAVYQAGLNKEFIYQGYDTTCLVELDEEPPREINKDALKIALHISLLLNAEIIPISQIMRKTVIDGSNTSGFQRTTLIARDGFIETSQGKVEIAGVFLEEDSARSISKNDKNAVYKLDRLGIPLIEIATYPDIKNPSQVKEAALMIGEILRSCKVKRGLGTIRQDINMSIRPHRNTEARPTSSKLGQSKEGARTELKGVQDPGVFIKSVDKEIERQLTLINKKEKVEPSVRNVLEDGNSEFLRPMPGASRMYPETDLPLLKISRDFINEAKKTLPKLRSEVEKELKKEGLSEEYIRLLFKQDKVNLYRELHYLLPKPNFIAKIVLLYPKEIASKSNKSIEEAVSLLEENYIDVLNLLIKGKIKEDNIKAVFEKIVDGKRLEEAIKFEKLDLNEIEEKIMKIIKEKPGLNENAYMGLVMKEFKGKITGKDASEIIKKLMK